MESSLKDKVVFITGGSKGIGKAIVEKFAELGAMIVFSYFSSEENAKKILNEVNSKSGGLAIKCDVSDFDQANSFIEKGLEEYGKIDILINNAGITKDNLMLRMKEDAWDQVINVNLKSCFNTSKAALKAMMKQRYGNIINVSSIVGIKGNAGQCNYAASKSGIIGFTKSLALEVGSRGINVNCIAPGFIETEMTELLDDSVIEHWKENIPLKRGGKPIDVANACVFLSSENASYITGQVLQIDGGLLT